MICAKHHSFYGLQISSPITKLGCFKDLWYKIFFWPEEKQENNALSDIVCTNTPNNINTKSIYYWFYEIYHLNIMYIRFYGDYTKKLQ